MDRHADLRVKKSKTERRSNVPQAPSLEGFEPRPLESSAPIPSHHHSSPGQACPQGAQPAFSFTWAAPLLSVPWRLTLPYLCFYFCLRTCLFCSSQTSPCPLGPWPNCYLLITHLPFLNLCAHTHTYPMLSSVNHIFCHQCFLSIYYVPGAGQDLENPTDRAALLAEFSIQW